MNSRKRADRTVKFCRTCGADRPVAEFIPSHRVCISCEALREAGKKRCATCSEVKALDVFYPRKGRPDGRASQCHQCVADRSRRWNARPEVRQRLRDRHLLQRFNITAAQYDEMLAAQRGGCAICGKPPTDDRALHVDHDHECCTTEQTCGECLRGLLCHQCNALLGNARDDISVLRRAIAYLEEGPWPTIDASGIGSPTTTIKEHQ